VSYVIEFFENESAFEEERVASRVPVETLPELGELIESGRILELGPLDEHGEVCCLLKHNGEVVDPSVIIEHTRDMLCFTDDEDPGLAEARRGNPRRRIE